MTRPGTQAQGKVLSTFWAIVAIVGAIVTVLVIQYVYATRVINAYHTMPPRGQFGDIFGGVNAFFTGLAFAGILVTIFLQRRDLEWQREELRDSTILSATTALMNAYGARLAPYWAERMSLNLEYERLSREVDHAEAKRTRARHDSFEYIDLDKRVLELRARRNSLDGRIGDLDTFWRDTRNKQEDLLSRLEELVEQTHQEQPHR